MLLPFHGQLSESRTHSIAAPDLPLPVMVVSRRDSVILPYPPVTVDVQRSPAMNKFARATRSAQQTRDWSLQSMEAADLSMCGSALAVTQNESVMVRGFGPRWLAHHWSQASPPIGF
jgi:hypothetical protein